MLISEVNEAKEDIEEGRVRGYRDFIRGLKRSGEI